MRPLLLLVVLQQGLLQVRPLPPHVRQVQDPDAAAAGQGGSHDAQGQGPQEVSHIQGGQLQDMCR